MDENKLYEQEEGVSLVEFYKDTPNIFVLSKEAYLEAQKQNIDLAEYWKEVSPEIWKEHVSEYLKIAYGRYLEDTKKKVEEIFDCSDFKYVSFHLALLEKQVERGPVDPANLVAYYALMKNYAEQTISFYSTYYGEDIFTGAQEQLPLDAQAAIKILVYVELEKKDKLLALTKLKECVEVYPRFAEAIRNYIQMYSYLEKERERKQKNERMQLKEQVVSQINDMLEKGQAERALAISQQLKQMVPDDLEIVALGLEARLMSLDK